MKKFSFVLVMSLILGSCLKDDSTNEDHFKTIDFEKFTLKTPLDWNRFYPQGTDGFYGGLTDNNDTLYFDYGPFAFSSIDNIQSTEYTISIEELVVNSFDSKIMRNRSDKENEFGLAFYTDKGDRENTNIIYSYNVKNENIIRQIFLSHQFK